MKREYTVKPASIGESKSADISQVFYPDGRYVWLMGSSTYVKEVLQNMRKELTRNNLLFKKRLSDPKYSLRVPFFPIHYKPELDTMVMYDEGLTNYFQNLVGILRWTVKLGQIDIAFEVSTLSKFLSCTQTGHIYQVLHIFKYLETHVNNDFSFDPM